MLGLRSNPGNARFGMPLRLTRQPECYYQSDCKERRQIRDISEITKLSTPEKILLVEDLWDNIASDESVVLVPQRHRDELDKRLKSYELGPGILLSLEELRAKIESGK